MKRFFSLLLTLVLCITCSAAFIGCNNDETSSPEQSSSIKEDVPPIEEPTIVQLTPADAKLTENLEKISVYDLKASDGNYAKLLFKDVSLGNVTKTLLDTYWTINGEPVITVNLYSDGSWRSLEDGVNKFNDVTNAIFNYELFSGSGLGLNKTQLAAYSDKKVADLMLAALLGQKISIESLLGGQSGGMMPSVSLTAYEDMFELLKPVLYITVAELDDLSLNGPTALVAKYGDVGVANYIGACCELIKSTATEETEVRDRVLAEVKAQVHALYGETAIKDIVSATKALKIDDVIGAVNSVLLEAGAPAELSNAVTVLLQTLFAGTVETTPALDAAVTVQMLISCVQDISNALVKNDVLTAIYGGLLELYGSDALAKDFVSATMALDVHDVIDFAAEVVIASDKSAETTVNEIVAYVKTLVSGTIGEPVFANETVTTSEVIAAIKAKTDAYVTNDALTEAYAQLTSLYEGKLFKDIVGDTQALGAESVIDAVGAVIKAAKVLEDGQVDAILAFGKTLFGGDSETSQTPMTVSDLAEDVKALIDAFAPNNAVVAEIYTQIVALYRETSLADFAQASNELKIDEIVDAFGKILIAANAANEKTVTAATALLKKVFAGTVAAHGIEPNLSVSALITDVAGLLNATGNAVPESVVTMLTNFFGNATLETVGKEVKSKTLGEVDEQLFGGAIFGEGYEELKAITVGQFIEYLNGGENATLDDFLKSIKLDDIISAFGGNGTDNGTDSGTEGQSDVAA